ncbi:MAG: hypothetical protein HRT67_08135 [Flavobacteriaceae bacterium]|nr:hypothetical protein [Flavobacteriaceae bacterium]
MAAYFFQQRKNKRFNYKSRHSSNLEQHGKQDFANKWSESRTINSNSKRKGLSLKALILLLVLLLIGIYFLESKFV